MAHKKAGGSTRNGRDSNPKYLGVKMLWQTGSIGSNLIATASKEAFIVQMSVVRTMANVGMSLLGEMAQPALKVWDVVDTVDTMSVDLANQTPFDVTLENMYSLAYRNGPLSNPLLSPAHRVGKIKSEQLDEFAAARLTTSEAVLVGINVGHDSLLRYASEQGSIAEKGTDASPVPQSVYHGGGDSRVENGTSLAHVAIAGKGAGMSDIKAVASQSVLSTLIGGDFNVKFSSGPAFGIVSQRVHDVSDRAAVRGLNVVHSDSGLVGAYVVADSNNINACVKTAVAGLKELADKGADAETLGVAKKTSEVHIRRNAQYSAELALDKASQLIVAGRDISPAEAIQAINDVSAEDVKRAATQMLSSKLNISAFGGVRHVPWAEELK